MSPPNSFYHDGATAPTSLPSLYVRTIVRQWFNLSLDFNIICAEVRPAVLSGLNKTVADKEREKLIPE